MGFSTDFFFLARSLFQTLLICVSFSDFFENLLLTLVCFYFTY